VLALDTVTYRYAGAPRPSVVGLTIELGAGEVVGVAGASESGKSTLCLVASGLAPRSIGGTLDGALLLDGRDVAGEPMHHLVSRVGIAFQNPTSQLSGISDSVFEEVAFGPMNLAVERDVVIERTWAALASMGIDALAERDPRRLSGGQQQLVAIAGLLAMRPQHIVLDEPTAQLDPAGTRLVVDAIARLAADGASILIAEQKTDLLAAVAGRMIVLAEGSVVLDGPAGDVLADARLPDLGVAPPAPVRLRRRAAADGVELGILDMLGNA
jgi:energy-coupling factor transport system ATP-binding protein